MYRAALVSITNLMSLILSGSGRSYEGITGSSRSGSDRAGSDSMSVSYIISLLQSKSAKQYDTFCRGQHHIGSIVINSKMFGPGEDVRKYVAGPPGLPGPPGAPGRGSSRFNVQEVAERVLSMMSGEWWSNYCTFNKYVLCPL